MSNRALSLAACAALFCLPATADASCGFKFTVENTGDVAFTVAKIKTENSLGVFDTKWTGTERIGPGNHHLFQFDVDSKCGQNHMVKLVFQDGLECYGMSIESGNTLLVEKKACAS